MQRTRLYCYNLWNFYTMLKNETHISYDWSHTFPHGRAIYSNRLSVSRRPAQKGVYHCFSFFYSRSASFIHKHGHNTSHRPFLSDLNKERYALHPIEQLISFVPELFNGCSLMSIFVGREWVITPFFVQDVTGGATNDVQDYEV